MTMDKKHKHTLTWWFCMGETSSLLLLLLSLLYSMGEEISRGVMVVWSGVGSDRDEGESTPLLSSLGGDWVRARDREEVPSSVLWLCLLLLRLLLWLWYLRDRRLDEDEDDEGDGR